MHKLFIKLSRKKKAYTEPNSCIKQTIPFSKYINNEMKVYFESNNELSSTYNNNNHL